MAEMLPAPQKSTASTYSVQYGPWRGVQVVEDGLGIRETLGCPPSKTLPFPSPTTKETLLAQALVQEGIHFTVYHTRDCLVIETKLLPAPEPLVIGEQSWPVGTVFDFMGGKKTSAGFPWHDYTDFGGIAYVGLFRCLDGDFACFKMGQKPSIGYFAWHPTPFGLMWGTDNHAGRCLEMTQARVRKP